MATKEFSFLDLDKALSKMPGFEMGSILETNTFSQTDEWISTGNYLLNAQLSGSLFGGIANNRSIGISGDPGCICPDETVEVYVMRTGASNRNFIIEGDE
jgi:hypothetical protein